MRSRGPPSNPSSLARTPLCPQRDPFPGAALQSLAFHMRCCSLLHTYHLVLLLSLQGELPSPSHFALFTHNGSCSPCMILLCAVHAVLCMLQSSCYAYAAVVVYHIPQCVMICKQWHGHCWLGIRSLCVGQAYLDACVMHTAPWVSSKKQGIP